jgi:hypothetical protein
MRGVVAADDGDAASRLRGGPQGMTAFSGSCLTDLIPIKDLEEPFEL